LENVAVSIQVVLVDYSDCGDSQLFGHGVLSQEVEILINLFSSKSFIEDVRKE
jgi:hypothetical protein